MTDRPVPIVGIDLGTTFSCVAHLDADGRPWTIPNAEGDLTTPSVAFFDRHGAIVGKEAVNAAEFEPERVAQFAKRDMGEDVFEKTIRGEHIPPEVVQAIILRKLKADAELRLGPFDKAVVTVPAFFNEPCRKATQDAGRLAGLDVIDIINEPTAAAITYGVQQGFLTADGQSHEREVILVYDLGGGTFDVSVMEIEGRNYNAIATAGDVYLGGIDWDRRIVDYMAEEFIDEFDVDPREDAVAYQTLMTQAAQAKHALSSREEMQLFFTYQGNKLRTSLTRTKLEFISEDLVDRTLLTCQKVLREAKLQWSDLTRLLLVGGSTRMPMIHSMLERETSISVDRSLSPDEAVAHGAAIYAGFLLKRLGSESAGMTVRNVCSHDLGILGVEANTGMKRRRIMIPKNTRLPVKGRCKFPTLKSDQRSVLVNVVEGGDASGNNATMIGQCIVTDLPAGLPAKTPVEVTFQYGRDGRLAVKAHLPTVKRDALLNIERAGGMSEEKLKAWEIRVQQGLPDPD
ncbi:MAG: Hsp70 family protein [Planctomycetota bacterium]|nr:Hsp70 family protein [Planctomycetota bacterium]